MLGPIRPASACGSPSNIWPSTEAASAFASTSITRWVIKLIKNGWMEQLEAYKKHCIDFRHLTILGAWPRSEVHVRHAEVDRSASVRLALEEKGSSLKETGITGIFSGGTEFTPQWTRFCIEELFGGPPGGKRHLHDRRLTVTHSWAWLAQNLSTAAEGYKISLLRTRQPRAVVEVVNFEDTDRVVGYGETGRARLTTLTKEFFMPGFLERDEGEREKPCEEFPWDGISGTRPFRLLAEGTTVGVY